MSIDASVGLFVGVLAAGLTYLIQRKFVPPVKVRMEEVIPQKSLSLLCIALEVENLSMIHLKRKMAILQINECDLPPSGKLHSDWQEPDQAKSIEVVKTEKLEPKELIHTEVLYHWVAKPLIQCRFSFKHDSRLRRIYKRRPDQHSTIKWFVNPSWYSTQ